MAKQKARRATGTSKSARSTASRKPVKRTKPAKPARSATKPASRSGKPAPRASTAPSLPLPPPPPPPPPVRDELAAAHDVGRLLRYGERFGPHKIDLRMLPLQLPIASGRIALGDPGMPKAWRVLDRPSGNGAFRVMLAIARHDTTERLAAIVVHVGRPPITRWTVAHDVGRKPPRTIEQAPRTTITTGWLALVDGGAPPGALAIPPSTAPIDVPLVDGRHALCIPCPNGEYAAYWASDAADRPVCLVVDLDAFTQKEWKAKPA